MNIYRNSFWRHLWLFVFLMSCKHSMAGGTKTQTPYKCGGLVSSCDEPGRVCSTTFQSFCANPPKLFVSCLLAGWLLAQTLFLLEMLGTPAVLFRLMPNATVSVALGWPGWACGDLFSFPNQSWILRNWLVLWLLSIEVHICQLSQDFVMYYLYYEYFLSCFKSENKTFSLSFYFTGLYSIIWFLNCKCRRSGSDPDNGVS